MIFLRVSLFHDKFKTGGEMSVFLSLLYSRTDATQKVNLRTSRVNLS